MGTIAGIVKNINGKFFAKDADGKIIELKIGDAVTDTMTVYGDPANAPTSEILIQMSSGQDTMLTGASSASFASELRDAEFTTDERTLFFEGTHDQSDPKVKEETVDSTVLQRSGDIVDVNSGLNTAQFSAKTKDYRDPDLLDREGMTNIESSLRQGEFTDGVIESTNPPTRVPEAPFYGENAPEYTPTPIPVVTSTLEPAILHARFTDNFVNGVQYFTSSGISGLTGDTGVDGGFSYKNGDTITFQVGNITVATFNSSVIHGDIVFIQDIAEKGLNDTNSNAVENIAIFLQALDDDLSDSTPDNSTLDTNDISNSLASYSSNITITQAVRDAFADYIDPTTNQPLNIESSGKKMISDALAELDIMFTRQTEVDVSGNNVFETQAINHVTDTIDALGDTRTPGTYDARIADTIVANDSEITYNYSTDSETGNLIIEFDAMDLLKNGTPQQVAYISNMEVTDVSVDAAYDGLGTLSQLPDGTYRFTVNAGVTPYQLEGFNIDFKAWDWTANEWVKSYAIDTYKSHLSAEVSDVPESSQYNQFTLKSALSFDTDQQLTVKFSPEGSGANFAEYADDFSVPVEYSNDGGSTWQTMEVVGTYMRDDYDKPLPLFAFDLTAGNKEVEIRIPIFDDPYEEVDVEKIDMLIEGDNFYAEHLQPGIIDNDPSTILPIVEVDYAIVSEEDGVATLTFSLVDADKNPITTAEDVTVSYTTNDLSAVSGSDYTAISGDITIPAGQSSVTVNIPIIDDAVLENTEFLSLDITGVSSNAVIGDPEASIRIYDNDGFNVTGTTHYESQKVVFTVNVESGIPDDVQFKLIPVNTGATATIDADYDSSTLSAYYIDGTGQHSLDPANLILPVGVQQFFISYDSNIDADYTEGDETVKMQVIASYTDTNGQEVQRVGIGTSVIKDDRLLSVSDVDVNEGSPYAVFKVTGSAGQPASLSLDGQNSDGDDLSTLQYFNGTSWVTYTSGTVTLNNDGELLVRVAISPEQESVLDGPETFNLKATNLSGVTSSGTGTIHDDGTGGYFAADNNTDTPSTPNGVTLDADQPQMQISNVTVEEGSTAVFSVTVGESMNDYTVTFSTSTNGSAEAEDITSPRVVKDSNGVVIIPNGDGSYTVPAGETSLTVEVPTLDDNVYEGAETFELNGKTEYMSTNVQGTGTIKDDGTAADGDDVNDTTFDPNSSDNDIPTLSIGNVTVTEAAGAYAEFSVSLSNQSFEDVTFSLASADNTAVVTDDYISSFEVWDGSSWNSATSATIVAGSTSLQVRVPLVNDAIGEPNETFDVTATVTAGTVKNSGGIATATATILDDDGSPSLSINDVTVNEATGTATLTVTLSPTSSQTITVDYTTVSDTAKLNDANQGDSSDYTATSGTLTFNPGDATKTITVTITDDDIYEYMESLNVVLSNATVDTVVDNTIIADNTGVITIMDNGTGSGGTDNDAPTMTIDNPIEDEGSTLHFTADVSNPIAMPMDVTFSLSDITTEGSSDYTNMVISYYDSSDVLHVLTQTDNGNGTVTVTVPAMTTKLDIAVDALNDTVYEGSETFKLTLSVNNGGDIYSVYGTGTILDNGSSDGDDTDGSADDDRPTLSIADATVEEGSTIAFAVTLSNASAYAEEMTLISSLDSAETDDFTQTKTAWTVTYTDGTGLHTLSVDLNGKFTLPAGVVAFNVNIPTTSDNVYEGAETFTLGINATSSYITDPAGSATGTIKDDGTAPDGNDADSSPDNDINRFSINSVSANEGEDAVFTVTRLGSAVENMTIHYVASIESGNSAESGDFTIVEGDLVFTPSDTSLNITVPTNVDVDFDDETFSVTISTTSPGAYIQTPVGIGTIHDLDLANNLPTGTDETVILAKNETDVLSVADFGYSDTDDDAFTKVQITSLESSGQLLWYNGTSWMNVVQDQEISVSDINNGYLVFKPATDGVGVPYDNFSFKVYDGTAYSAAANTITYNIGNTLSISNPLPVDEGKSTVFIVSLDEARSTDTLFDLTVGGVDSSSDYNQTLYYKKIAVDGQSWSWEIASGDQVTIAQGQTSVEVKITTLADAVADNAEPLTLTAAINGDASDMANSSATGSTTINDYPSLRIDTAPFVTEGNFAVFEIGLSSPKATDTVISMYGDGTASMGTDYTNSFEYSIDGGTTWLPMASWDLTIPGSTTEIPSIMVRTETSVDGVAEFAESLNLHVSTVDSGIANSSVSATTQIVDKLTLEVYEEGDDPAFADTATYARTVTLEDVSGNYTYSLVGQGQNGIVTDNGDGTLTYEANTDFSGTDTFTYLLTNKTTGLSVVGNADVNVIANADTPEILISANIGSVESVVDDNAWKAGTVQGTTSKIDYNVSDTPIAGFSLSNSSGSKAYIMQTFAATDGMVLDLAYNSTYTAGAPILAVYWATLDALQQVTLGSLAVSSSAEDFNGTVTVPVGSGYNTIVFLNDGGNNTTAQIDSVSFTPAVAVGTTIYDVNIYDALTDADNEETGTINKEELQSVTAQVKSYDGTTVLDSTDYFNYGTYDSTSKTWTFAQADLQNLQASVSTTLATNGFKIEATATSKELSNDSTATTSAPVTITLINIDDRPTIGDQTITVTNAANTVYDGGTIDTHYSTDTGAENVFSWNPSMSILPDLYAQDQRVTLTYNNVTGTVTGTINNGITQIFQTTINMADNDATTLTYDQIDTLLGVKTTIAGGIVLPGGGNNDIVVLGFNTAGGTASGVDAIVTAHNLIEDTSEEIASATAEHTVNTNNYYIGVDSNNMNAGDQLIFDFATSGTNIDGQGNDTHENSVTEMNIKLFNFSSAKSGDQLYITILTIDPNNPTGDPIRENVILTQDSDYSTELEYTVTSASGNPMIGVEFLAGNESSFKLGIEGIGAVNYDEDFNMTFGYDITDNNDAQADSGTVTITVNSDGATVVNTALDTNDDSSIVYDTTDHTINGGAGVDTLIFTGGNDIDFTGFATVTTITNMEVFDLKTDTTANSLTNLSLADVIAMTDSNNELTITGGTEDTVSFQTVDNWTQSSTIMENGTNYEVYTNSGDSSVQVKVEDHITFS